MVPIVESVIISTRPSRLFRGRPWTWAILSELVRSLDPGETGLALAAETAVAGGVHLWARTIAQLS